jgi:hypothetical protein
MNQFTPYTIAVVDYYKTSSMSWFGICGHSIEIWGLFYDETEITRGGKTAMNRLLRIANGAYNLGYQYRILEEEIENEKV